MPSVTVRLSEEMLSELDELAGAMDRTRTWLVADALKDYIARERQWVEAIREGQASIERGEGIPHEEVMARMQARIKATSGKARKKSAAE